MWNKRIIIIFSVLLALVVIVILGSTMFNLKQVEIKFKEDTLVLDKDKVAESMVVYKGDNLLFMSEKKIVEGLNSAFPYATDIELERKFPNSLSVHMAERQELFTVKLNNQEGKSVYFMYDKKGYALRSDTANTNNKENSEIKRNTLIEGISQDEVVQNSFGKRILLTNNSRINVPLEIFDCLASFEKSYSNVQIRQFIYSIDVSNMNKVRIKLANDNGLEIQLLNADKDLKPQIQLAIGSYYKLTDAYKNKGKIIICFDNTRQTYTAAYSPTN